MLDTDPDRARATARLHLATYLGLPNYANNWRRLGYTDDDIADGGSDRLVDALVVWGDESTIAARVQEHRDAGADHVCVQVLTDDPRGFPRDQWRALAPALDAMSAYDFDRFLRYDELTAWLHDLAGANPGLVTVESYGRSHEGRDLWLVTVTDSSTGPHDTKPAHWVDASIHAVELTATVAACALLQHLVDGHRSDDEKVVAALATRTFYVVPRVNPDGAEWALADQPRFRRSSTRPWPWSDAHRWPGAHTEDVDGDGRVLQMRIADPRRGVDARTPTTSGCSCPCPRTAHPPGAPRYRLLHEGTITDHDGFTVPTPRPPEGLDLNRNFPAGWATQVLGSGDHPLSEPEIDALVRAIVARPNVCGYNAFHTSGGVLLRPVLDPAGLGAAAHRRVDVEAARRDRHAPHRLPGALRVRGLHVRQGRDDERRRRRLGVRAPRRVLVDDGVLGRRRGGDWDEAGTDAWYVGPSDDAGARRAALGRRARPRRVRAVVPVRAPAARAGRARRLAVPRDLDQPAGIDG